MRWWDGAQWTDQFQDAPPPANTGTGTPAATAVSANPRADAKAAKAYAKASRPWYKKKRWIAGIALLIIIIAAAAGSGGGGGDDDKSSNDTSSSSDKSADTKKDDGNSGKKSDAKANAFGSSEFPLQNGDWRLDSIKVTDDGFGGWAATGRVTYTGDDEDGGNNLFTVTLFKGKDVVGTLTGGGNTVKPGTTVTVQFIETGNSKYVKGPYKYDFQNDL
jgi:hypothetical protein